MVARGLSSVAPVAPRSVWPAMAVVLTLASATGAAGADEGVAQAGREAHAMLYRLCDDFGGRLTGSAANEGALARIEAELAKLGAKPERMPFTMPGWIRGPDEVELVAPFRRPLRVAALSYSPQTPAFAADVIDLDQGREGDYPEDAKGKVGLISPSTPLQTRIFARIAAERGLRGLLFINREGGGQLLARTGSFLGETLALPVYSITQEEGRWLQRLRSRGTAVRVRMDTRSQCREIETANLSLVIPGRSADRIIVGAHVDSWDLGQGALDNGLGIAQLYALATLYAKQPLAKTLQLVWLNGEEQGLWGSRHHAKSLGNTPVVAMINLDMVGVPIAVNALGDGTLVPTLQRWNEARGEGKLPKGVENINWFGSDHSPYQFAGVRALTFNAPIPRESVRYYHDLADTIDKLPEQIVVDSTATIASVLRALADDPSLVAWRRDPAETKKLFTSFGLEPRMRAVGLWPFEP